MKRAVRMVLRLVASAVVLFGALAIGLEYVRHRVDAKEISWVRCGLGMAGIALGVFLFLASASLAEQLTDDVDD